MPHRSNVPAGLWLRQLADEIPLPLCDISLWGTPPSSGPSGSTGQQKYQIDSLWVLPPWGVALRAGKDEKEYQEFTWQGPELWLLQHTAQSTKWYLMHTPHWVLETIPGSRWNGCCSPWKLWLLQGCALLSSYTPASARWSKRLWYTWQTLV